MVLGPSKNYKVVLGTTVNLNVLQIPRASHSVLLSRYY